MRLFFFYLMLSGFLSSAFGQISVTTQNSTEKSLETDRWNLDKYVYSHTYYKNGINDKPVIDFAAIDNWVGLGKSNDLSLSGDGNYFAYTVVTGSSLENYNRKRPDSLIVQSTINGWRESFLGAEPGFFSADSKQYIFRDKETLCLLKISGNTTEFIKRVNSYKVPFNKKNEWMAYQLKDANTSVILQSLTTTEKITFDSISNYSFDKSSTWLVCQKNNETRDIELYNLKNGKRLHFFLVESYLIDKEGHSIVIKTKDGDLSFANLKTGKAVVIFHRESTQGINNFALDGSGNQVVCMVQDENKLNTVWYWKPGMDNAKIKLSNTTKGIDADLLISGQVAFTDDGRYIQFYVQPKPDLRKPMTDAVQLDVWSYEDKVIQSAQPSLLKEIKSFCLINIENNQVTRLENDGESVYLLKGDFALIKKKGKITHGDRFWDEGYDRDSNYLVSLRNGSRFLLQTTGGESTIWFSPGGHYLVYFDSEKGCHYFSYEFNTGKLNDISIGVKDGELGLQYPFIRTKAKPRDIIGPAAWISGDKGILVYDNHDIWQLDLSGKKRALNLTNGYGNLHKIMFSLSGGDRFTFNPPIVYEKQRLLLKAFNEGNKYDGFYRTTVGQMADPETLNMGPYFFEDQRGVYGSVETGIGMRPLKAAGANVWILKRQSTCDAANYFITTDFKIYKQLTFLDPQKKYNWYTAELVSFPQLDGSMSQAVLYKPENFDAFKKYPVIISFYGPLSGRLYQYLEPAYIDRPNIFDSPAWLLSHGYLVLLPDIYQTPGQWGPSTLNTMDGAAKYLRKISYVDSLHIGAVAHSNSGVLGYYLLTHSNSFAAMSIGGGTTDMISGALSSLGGLKYFEIGHRIVPGFGTDLWKNKNVWVDHTAVMNVDKTTSPLLLFHNKSDGVPIQEAQEMFIALRRLEKPVWWLQYDQGGHTLTNLRDLRDFTIRYTQFFDHYLKVAPMPVWMSEGIPYKIKGVESRYELLQ